MKNWIYLIGFFVLTACNGSGKKNESISFEDLAGSTGELVEDSTKVISTDTLFLETPFDFFVHNIQTEYDTSVHSEFHPIDRFTYNQRKKILFKSKIDVKYGETDVTPRAEFFYYSFSDTTKTKNAFYNWLDCFGSDCQIITLKEDEKSLKSPPMFTLIYDTMIVVMNYRCEDQKFNWKPIQDSVKTCFGRNYNYQIDVGCGGPLKWK